MKKITWIALCLGCSFAFAEKKVGFGVDIEPVVGYERVQKLLPTAHTSDRLVYGARLTAGVPLIAAEAEYLRSTDTETFTSPDMSITEISDKAKLGLRSSFALSKLIRLSARAGAQAKMNHRSQTVSNVTTETTDPIVYNPYGGAGLKVRLGPKLAFTADMVVVFGAFPDMNQNEYQVTAGFVVRLP